MPWTSVALPAYIFKFKHMRKLTHRCSAALLSYLIGIVFSQALRCSDTSLLKQQDTRTSQYLSTVA